MRNRTRSTKDPSRYGLCNTLRSWRRRMWSQSYTSLKIQRSAPEISPEGSLTGKDTYGGMNQNESLVNKLSGDVKKLSGDLEMLKARNELSRRVRSE